MDYARMTASLVRFLDAFVPRAVKEQNKAEETNRARTLVAVIMMNLAGISAGLVASLIAFTDYEFILGIKAPYMMLITLSGHASALSIFMLTARHVLSSNIFGFTLYASLVLTALAVGRDDALPILLFLQILPLYVTFTGNFRTGVFWVVAIALTPLFFLALAGFGYSGLFVVCWIGSCLGLYIVNLAFYVYIGRLSERLSAQYRLLESAAARDPLTGIANRATFEMRVNESIALCNALGSKAAIVYIDLDHFKPINDTYGHHAGDVILTAVADRLRQLVRDTDVVARLGGDEFAILVDPCTTQEVEVIFNRIKSVLEAPVDVAGQTLNVGCSLGIVIYPDDGADLTLLMRKADARMYELKKKR